MHVFGYPTWLGASLFVIGVVGMVCSIASLVHLSLQRRRTRLLLTKMMQDHRPPPTTFE